MNTTVGKSESKAFLKRLTKYLAIVFGSAVYAIGFQFFMYPNSIVSGGIVGIAMLINHFTRFPVGVMTIIVYRGLAAFRSGFPRRFACGDGRLLGLRGYLRRDRHSPYS